MAEIDAAFVSFQEIGALLQNIGLSEKAVAAFLKVNDSLKRCAVSYTPPPPNGHAFSAE
jgi:hypothetical protein